MEQSTQIQHHLPHHITTLLAPFFKEPVDVGGGSYREMSRQARIWRSFCEGLDALDGGEVRRWMPLLQEHASRLASEIRVAPARWWQNALESAHEPRLALATTLTIHDHAWTPKEFGNLLSNPALTNLEVLRIEDSALTDRVAALIAQSPWLENLRELYLGRNLIGDVGVEAIACSQLMEHLEVLSLAGNQVTDRGVEALLDEGLLRSLRSLYLDDNTLTDQSAQAIAISKVGKRLRHLGLGYNSAISEKGVRAITNRLEIGLPNMEYVDMMGCGIKESEVFALTMRVRRLANARAIS